MFIIDYVLDKFGYVRKPVPFPPEKPAKKVARKTVVKKVTARKK